MQNIAKTLKGDTMEPNYIQKTEEHFPHLTKGLKKVANHLLNDPIIFAIHPAKKIGSIIGVSETMVIRFCSSIGYKGFSMLQNEIRKHLLKLSQHQANDITESEGTSRFIEDIKNDIRVLTKNLESLEVEGFQSIVETLMDSERIVIAGYYQSYTFAHWLLFNINYILGNASLYRPETDARVLEFLPEKSCVFVFSFYRYAVDTIKFAEEAKKKGIKVIAFTDSRVAPIVEFADYLILANFQNESILRKGPITLSIINSILHELVRRVDQIGQVPKNFKYYITEGEQE